MRKVENRNREHARKAREQAAALANGEEKARLIRIADRFDALADIEEGKPLPVSRPAPARFIVQFDSWLGPTISSPLEPVAALSLAMAWEADGETDVAIEADDNSGRTWTVRQFRVFLQTD